MSLLRVSNPLDEGVYQGSKWLKIQVLCELEEMNALCELLRPFWIFPLTGVVNGDPIEEETFLSHYALWIEELKRGKVPEEKELKKVLACAFTDDLEALWLQKVKEGFLVKIGKPVVQVQSHYFTYSTLDSVFRPMSMGKGSIFWGLQFSFPQIYQDPKTMEFIELGRQKHSLFQKIQTWSREYTRATPFIDPTGKKVNSSIRIGKKALCWMSQHPQLIEQKIGVAHGD